MITLFENIQILIWNFLSSLLLRFILNYISLLFNKLIKTKCYDESGKKTIIDEGPDIYEETLFLPSEQIKWLRPPKMCESPQFIIKQNEFSVLKGESGDTSLMAAISILAQDSSLFLKVVPESNSFEGNSRMFLFR